MRPGTEGGARDDGTGGTRHPGAHRIVCSTRSASIDVSAFSELARCAPCAPSRSHATTSSGAMFPSSAFNAPTKYELLVERAAAVARARTIAPSTRAHGRCRDVEQCASRACADTSSKTIRDIATSTQRVAARGVGPVDHDRARRGDITFSGCRSRCTRRSPSPIVGQPVGRGDHVQAVVEIGELRGVPRHAPRLAQHRRPSSSGRRAVPSRSRCRPRGPRRSRARDSRARVRTRSCALRLRSRGRSSRGATRGPDRTRRCRRRVRSRASGPGLGRHGQTMRDVLSPQ